MPHPPAQPALVRLINMRAVFEVVHAEGPTTHPEIVQRTGLSKPTVSEVLSQLSERGLVRGVGRTSGRRGPTAQLYGVDPAAGWVLCLDVGREWLRSVVTDLSGAVVGRRAIPTPGGGAGAVIDQLRSAARQAVAEAGLSPEDVTQAVVGTPGVFRPGEDRFSLAPHLLGWESAAVTSEIRKALAAPVVFENDANLAALGEMTEGCARGRRDFVLLWVGTGVGMGVILDGALRRGASGLAGEIGYLRLDPVPEAEQRTGAPPAWGAGAFERQVSAQAVVELAAELGVIGADQPAAVFSAAREGDPRARQVVDIEARRLAGAIASVSAVLDPELVVLSGSVGAGGGDLLVDRLAEFLPLISPFSPQLAGSALGSEAVLIGARAMGTRLALDRLLGDSGRPPLAGDARLGPSPVATRDQPSAARSTPAVDGWRAAASRSSVGTAGRPRPARSSQA